MSELISEQWLKQAGFRWSQFDRQPDRHWTLWLGDAIDDHRDLEDVGLEVAPGYDGKWYCWLRSDTAGRYTRFVHVRHLRLVRELVGLIEAISGRNFDPADVFFGALRTRQRAARFRAEADRLDRRLLARHEWRQDGADESLAGAKADHLVAFETACHDAGKRLGRDQV